MDSPVQAANPTYRTVTAGSVTGSAVIVLDWIASLAHVSVPNDVVVALVVLGTAVAAPFVHKGTVLAGGSAPANPTQNRSPGT